MEHDFYKSSQAQLFDILVPHAKTRPTVMLLLRAKIRRTVIISTTNNQISTVRPVLLVRE